MKNHTPAYLSFLPHIGCPAILLVAIVLLSGACAASVSAQAGGGRISGRAYVETDGNRGFAPGVDVPLAGAIVRLCPGADTNCASTPLQQAATDAAGFYDFANLAPGSYSINLDSNDPKLYKLSVNGEINSGIGSSQFVIAANSEFERDFAADLGIPADSDIGTNTAYGVRNAYYGGRIWNDANRNGINENSEAKFSGVAVSLYYDYNADGVPDLPYSAADYVTNSIGQYVLKISGHTAAPGTYPVVVCINPENFNAGKSLAGYQPTNFSGGDPNDQIDNDNNIAAATRFGFCTKSLHPLRGKLMATGETERMTAARGAPSDSDDRLFDETIDLGFVVAPAGNTPAVFGATALFSPERVASGEKANNPVYGPTSDTGGNAPESGQTNASAFFINRPSHEQSFGLFNRHRTPAASLVNPALTAVQSLICGTGRALRIETRESGMFTISPAAVASANFNSANALRLFNNGREEPIGIAADGSIVFFGRGLDTANTNTRTYFLSDALSSGGENSPPLRIPQIGATKARKRVRLTTLNNPQADEPESPATDVYQRQESVYETNTLYVSNIYNGRTVDNFYSLLVAAQPVSFAVAAPGIVTSPPDGNRTYLTVEFKDLTGTAPSYELQVYLNDQLLATIPGASTRQQVVTMEVPGGLARASNTVTVKRPDGKLTLVKRAILNYTRPYAAADAAQQVFEIKKNNQVAVTGYAAGEAIRVFDISKFGQTTELKVSLQSDPASGGVYFNVPIDSGSDRKIVVVRASTSSTNDAGFFKPQQIAPRANDGLQANAAQSAAEYLIVGPGEFDQPMERLRAYRNGQGVSGKIIDIGDIYDEYAFGRAEPEALTEFLRDTTRWAVKPKYIFLAGNATFDPKNYLGTNVPNRVPTTSARTAFGDYSADDLMFDIAGNEVGDFYWGRFPAWSAEMLDAYVSKIINYENAPLSPNRPVLFFDDDNIEYNFDRTLDHFQGLLPAGASSAKILKSGRPAQAVKNEVIDFINANHPKIINYAGHGATGQLSSSNIFDNQTADRLTNRDELAFGIILACLSFGTDNPYTVSVGESLVKAPGGIVAGIGSTALTGLASQEDLVAEFYEQIKANPDLPAGEALQKSKAKIYPNTSERPVVSTWVLIGDPLIRIR